MNGSTKRRGIRAAGLSVLLVLGILVWPGASIPGQDKEERKEPPPKEITIQVQTATTPQVTPPTPSSVAQTVQPQSTILQPPPPIQPAPPIAMPVIGSGSGQPIFLSTFEAKGFSGPSRLRFPFTIDAKTPLKELLPAASKIKNAGAILADDLTQVPEVEIGAPVVKDAEAMKNTAFAIAKINHLNSKKTDGFLEALRDDRPDLHGLPFAMGDACRTKGERNRQFAAAVQTVRSFIQQTAGNADQFWALYKQNHAQCDAIINIDQVLREHDNLARIAALTQIMAPESLSMKLGLVKYLSTRSHVEATRALAKLAIFSTEDEVRRAATDALKVRRERDYTDILLQGMRYPLPAVAKRAGEALVKLERNDLVPKLVEMLDEPDPRAPVVKEVNKKKVPVVREMVRINHHRNCLLCHAPGNTGTVAPETLSVAVPTPDQPLNPPSGGYQQFGSPDLLVRLDVTYLRQDFSMMQAVADAAPWPEMQRFDFLVRTRELTDEEAVAFQSKLDKREKGQISPYQRAAVTTLRELTGKDTAPTAQAWRELLDLQE